MDSLSCVLFPALCRLCGQPLARLSPVPVCTPCLEDLPRQSGILCSRCGEDLGVSGFVSVAENHPGLCQPCRLTPPPFRKAVAFGTYQGTLRSLIHLLKFDGIQPLAKRLAPALAQSILTLAGEAPTRMLVVPVPLYASRRRLRGFNQSERLAAAALRIVRRQHPEWSLTLAPGLLRRSRATERQTRLTARQRRRNLHDAFSVPEPGRVQDAHILLVDDIYTTGATARACSQTLIRAGAASVYVATLARAQREAATPVQFEQSLVTAMPMHEDVAFWDSAIGMRKGQAPTVH